MKNQTIPYFGFFLAASVLAAPAQSPAQSPPLAASFPSIPIPKTPGVAGMAVAQGSAIITALGPLLPQVAAYHGLSDTAFGSLCLADRDLAMDQKGNLLYLCAGNQEGLVAPDNAGTAALLNYPANQTLFLHSKPGQTRVIYLDFDGHTTPPGTPWYNGSSFVSPPYSTDLDPSFNATELANIQAIWKQVSEDYAPWDVDVTTEEPPLASLQRNPSAVPPDATYGIRVVIGGSSYDWYGAGAGGIAYLHSFSWETDIPCYVFPAQLGGGWPKYVAEAASHEIGHTLSLYHDGLSTGATYYTGNSAWAPIMGSGYYAATTQFSRGEYPGSNNYQDDTAIINSHIPRTTDLVGDAIASALPLGGTSFAVTGLIESRLDADLFRVIVSSGTLSFNAAPAAPNANLDIGLSLYDGSGNLIANSNPTTLSASLSAPVPTGTYYLAVDGVGSGTTSTGYSDYASLGQFTLTGTVPPPPSEQPPTAVCALSAPTSGTADLVVNFSSAGSTDPQGTALIYDWDFGDNTSSTEANPSHTYSTPGFYSASLVVFNAAGLSTASSLSISVLPKPEPPAAESIMTAPTIGIVPLTVLFSSSGSMDPEGGTLTYHWDFGDGTSSTEANPTHVYTAARTYYSLLTVTDPTGLTNTSSLGIAVFNPPQPPVPVVSQSTPTSGEAPLAVLFSSAGSYDLNRDALSYAWNFGDGTSSTAPSPSHLYALPGSYTATLTLTDSTGLSAAASLTISALQAPRPPVAVVSQSTPISGDAPLAVLFSSAGSSDPDGTPLSYLWQFGDGASSTAPNPSYTYPNPGNYTATLAVTDPTGLKSSASVNIAVLTPPLPPLAALATTSPTTGAGTLTVQFSGDKSTDPENGALRYSWNSGNGQSSTAPNPSFTYSLEGSYLATLTVTDPTGLSNTASLTITVLNPANVLAVSALSITTNSPKTGTVASVTVTVKDLTGKVRSNVTATGTWSGAVAGTASAKTDTKGAATLASPSTGTKATATFTFTLTSLSLAGTTYGATYDPSLDARTTISITK